MGWRKHFAAVIGIDRTSYYRQPTTLKQRDTRAIAELVGVHTDHPLYGVRRLALHLGWSHQKTRRIRTLAGIHIDRPMKKRRTGRQLAAQIPIPQNALAKYASFKNKARPQDGQDYTGMTNASAWVQDFTYLWFERQWCYLAVVLNLPTR